MHPLSHTAFRWVLFGFVISALGSSIQDVGAEWLMTAQTLHPLQVALLVTAIRLPRVLLGVPAGVFADLFGSRRVLLFTQCWMLFFAGVMAALAGLHALTPWPLLLLTFAMFLGTAFQDPAMFAGLVELVPSQQMPLALAYQMAGFALARLVGPIIGGAIVRACGPPGAYVMNAAALVVPLGILILFGGAWKPRAAVTQRGCVKAAILGTLMLVRRSKGLQTVLTFSALSTFAGTAHFALFPILARTRFHMDSAHFGWALSCLNAGTIIGTLLVPYLLRVLRMDALIAGASVLAGAGMFFLPHIVPSFVFAYCLTLGFAFAGIETGLFTAAQISVPDSLRGRVLGALLTVCAIGATCGSLLWGSIATRMGVGVALPLAGVVSGLAGLFVARSGLGAAPEDRSARVSTSAH